MNNLQLHQQICFPIYATSRLITQSYTTYLKPLDLTYPQYLVLLVLWEEDNRCVQEIGSILLLENNTLTPLLNRMEKKHLIEKHKDTHDQRIRKITLTKKGQDLKENAKTIPKNIFCKILPKHIAKEDIIQCKKILEEVLLHLRL